MNKVEIALGIVTSVLTAAALAWDVYKTLREKRQEDSHKPETPV